jgi:hypothetical protein
MRRMIFLLMLAFAFSTVMTHAQTQKGKWYLGTFNRIELNVGSEKEKYGGETNTNYKYTDFNFEPKVGYCVIKNFPIGLFIYMDFWSDKSGDDNGYKTVGQTFVIGPFAKYYIANLHGLQPYVEIQAGYGVDNYKYRSDPNSDWQKTNEGLFVFRTGGGFTYFFNDFVGLDAFLGYNRESYKLKETDNGGERASDDDDIYIYNEFLMQVGVVVTLGK